MKFASEQILGGFPTFYIYLINVFKQKTARNDLWEPKLATATSFFLCKTLLRKRKKWCISVMGGVLVTCPEGPDYKCFFGVTIRYVQISTGNI